MGGSIKVLLNHWNTTLSPSQAVNVAQTFNSVLSAIIEDPDRVVQELDLVSPSQWQQIQNWNNCASEIEIVNFCTHELFAQQVAKQGNAQAVNGWDGDFTYKELDDVTTYLAHHLVSLGVGPEVFVPVCFEKSVWAIVAMWAVNKAVRGPSYHLPL